MKVMLTSSLGGFRKVNGVREPSLLFEKNKLLSNLKTIWPQDAKVLIIAADPIAHEKNDNVCACFKQSLTMSQLSISCVEACDDRNSQTVANLNNYDVIILMGGHVPTQNKFLHQLKLRDRLSSYNGIVIAWSAGSMNCADIVYAGPELEGEAVSPLYQRWITGLGVTDINIFPHFQSLKDSYLDGLRLIEDITFADSVGHEIIALNDGSYIMIDSGRVTLHGEAYLIKDGQLRQICQDDESILLR